MPLAMGWSPHERYIFPPIRAGSLHTPKKHGLKEAQNSPLRSGRRPKLPQVGRSDIPAAAAENLLRENSDFFFKGDPRKLTVNYIDK